MRLVKADEQRRARVRELIRSNALTTGRDYFRAAMIFQHSMTPDDFLFAHLLAIVGISKGNRDSRWVSAATLDRYLQSIHQSQVFGTQFTAQKTTPYTQEPYNRQLFPDELRKQLCVPSLQQQQETLVALNRHEDPDPPDVCH